jgi:GLPGLI family protein
MKKIILIITFALFLIGLCLNAQEISDSVMLRICYTSQMRYSEELKELSQDEKILDIGSHSSHFYSRWAERNQDIHDSVFSRGGKLEDYYAAIDRSGFPHSKTRFNVFKNYPIKNILTYTVKNLRFFRYEEPMTTPKWEMINGDTVIVGYHCKKAKTTFRGRTWIVWYTLDIPYRDGPWKLFDLPGLILKANDTKGDFIFNCIGIEKGNMRPIVPRKVKYLKSTPEEIEKNERLFLSDFDAYIAKMGFPKMQGFDAQGKPLVQKLRVPCLLEYRLKDKK